MLALLAGCTVKPAAKSPTLGDVSQSVRSNLTAYTNLVSRGKIGVNAQVRMQAAKARFEIAYRLALEANIGDTRFPAHGDVVKTANELKRLVSALK